MGFLLCTYSHRALSTVPNQIKQNDIDSSAFGIYMSIAEMQGRILVKEQEKIDTS